METREKTRAEKRRQAETRKELHDDNIQRMLNGEAPIFRTKGKRKFGFLIESSIRFFSSSPSY